MSADGLFYLTWFGVWIGAACLIGGLHTAARRALTRRCDRAVTRPPHRQSSHVRVVPEPTVPRQLTHANSHRQEHR